MTPSDAGSRRSWHEPKAPDAVRIGERHFAPAGDAGPEPGSIALSAEAAGAPASLQDARARGDRAAEARLLMLLGCDHMRLGRFDWATEAFSEAVEVHELIGDRAGAAAALADVAVSLARRGDWSAARAQLEELSRAHGRQDLHACVWVVNVGALLVQAGEGAGALDRLDGAFSLARALDDDGLKAAALNNAALAYLATERPDEALGLLQRAALLAQRAHDRLGAARAYNNVGVVHVVAGRNFEAIPYFEMGLAMAQDAGDGPATIEATNNNVIAFERQYLEVAADYRARFAEAVEQVGLTRSARLDDAAALTVDPVRTKGSSVAAADVQRGGGAMLDALRAMQWLVLDLAPS